MFSKTQRGGFVVLPVLLIILSLMLLLPVVTEQFYTHTLLAESAATYFRAQKILAQNLPEIEAMLPKLPHSHPQPQDQKVRLETYAGWQSFKVGQYTLRYQTELIRLLTANDDDVAIYSTLIGIDTEATPKLLLYELISTCALAEHVCRPLQWFSVFAH